MGNELTHYRTPVNNLPYTITTTSGTGNYYIPVTAPKFTVKDIERYLGYGKMEEKVGVNMGADKCHLCGAKVRSRSSYKAYKKDMTMKRAVESVTYRCGTHIEHDALNGGDVKVYQGSTCLSKE